MKRDSYKTLRILESQKQEMFKKIEEEAIKSYPINSEVLFKHGNMKSYGLGIVKRVLFFHGELELVLVNYDTRKYRRLSTHYLHADYK